MRNLPFDRSGRLSLRRALRAAAPTAAILLAAGGIALAANTTFFTNIGDQVFPFTAPTTNPSAPGTIDNMTIGATTPAAGTFSTVSATTYAGAGIATKLAAPGPIGSTTPSTGAFTTLAASGAVSGAGFNAFLASPPAIGGTAPAAGTFTALTVNTGIIGPAPVACGASCSPVAGSLTTIGVNSGGSATLPTSSGSGSVIRVRVMITQTSGTIKVLLTTVTDVIIGTAIGENAGTAKVFVGNAAANHSIAMPFAGTQPSGGFAGDLITCTDMATGTWACDITYQAGTTPTTPYSTSTT